MPDTPTPSSAPIQIDPDGVDPCWLAFRVECAIALTIWIFARRAATTQAQRDAIDSEYSLRMLVAAANYAACAAIQLPGD